MKYVSNHWWKFEWPNFAWMCGLMQTIAVFSITAINYFVILFSDTVLELAKDFTALLIISNFDDDDYLSRITQVYATQEDNCNDILTD